MPQAKRKPPAYLTVVQNEAAEGKPVCEPAKPPRPPMQQQPVPEYPWIMMRMQ